MHPPSQQRYLHLRVRRPSSLWPVARLGALAAVAALGALLLTRPALGLVVFWGLVIPLLPPLFLLAPGLWRNVCPMAAANQLPRVLGISRARALPRWLERHGYAIGMLLFFGLVAARPALLERNGAALAMLLAIVLAVPFLAGLLFKGKSGFCGSVCPLRPVQGLYARAPALKVANSHCKPCVGCTPNCQDLKPATALLDDLHGGDTLRAAYRRTFAGALPGFTYVFFTLPAGAGTGAALAQLGVAMLAGIGLLSVLELWTSFGAGRLTALAGAVSFGLFAWFNVAAVAAAVGELLAAPVQPWAVWEGRTVALALVTAWLVRSLRLAAARESAAEPALPVVTAGGARPVMAGNPPVQIPDRRSQDRPMRKPTLTLWPEGRQAEVEPGSGLVAALQAVGVEPPAGCGSGICGADPVYVLAGAEALSPAAAAERATLARLGLAPHARLACSTRVLDDVTVSLEAEGELTPARAPERRGRPAAERVVIIGNGVAGVTAASHVRRLEPATQIDLISESPNPFYNRLAIARLIHERGGLGALELMPEGWYDEQRITQWLNTRAALLDRERREVVLGTGESLPYDRVILATGARAAMPPLPGVGHDGVFAVRRAEDAQQIRGYVQARAARRAVVIGGGLLGLEAADALVKLGLECTVVERDAWLARRELDARSAQLLQEHLARDGTEAHTGAEVRAITGAGRAEGVELVGGLVLDADIVLVCAGIVPEVALAREAGLAVGRGVVVDAHMRTSDPDVLACGDVVEFQGALLGRWSAGVAQAEVAAVTALGGQRTYTPAPLVTSLKLTGVDVASIGLKEAGPEHTEIVDEGKGYRKIVLAAGRMVGAVVLGTPAERERLAEAVELGRDVSHDLEALRRGDWSCLGLDSTAAAPAKPKRRAPRRAA